MEEGRVPSPGHVEKVSFDTTVRDFIPETESKRC